MGPGRTQGPTRFYKCARIPIPGTQFPAWAHAILPARIPGRGSKSRDYVCDEESSRSGPHWSRSLDRLHRWRMPSDTLSAARFIERENRFGPLVSSEVSLYVDEQCSAIGMGRNGDGERNFPQGVCRDGHRDVRARDAESHG